MEVAFVMYCDGGTSFQAGVPDKVGHESSTHSEYVFGQVMVMVAPAGEIVNCGGASGVGDKISALYGAMAMLPVAGLPAAVTT